MRAPLSFRLIAALLAFGPVLASAADCDALLKQHLVSDMKLDFQQFDQDEHQGWRALSSAGCDLQAVTLIEQYSATQAHPHPVMAWHRAQILAKAGKTPEAIEATKQTLRPRGSDADSGFDWNDYANATIAFLQGDLPALKLNRERLAASAKVAQINEINLKAVDRLVRCFGQAYKAAYDCPDSP